MPLQVEGRYLDYEIPQWVQVGNAGRTSRYVILSPYATSKLRMLMPTLDVAYERQSHQARLRTEIARSKTEQNEYLKNVELARVLDKRAAKKAATGIGAETGGSAASAKEDTKGHSKGYRQRPAVEKTKTLEGRGMDSMLGNVFG